VAVLQGFLLGLAVGPTCLAYCVPLVVPYLLGQGRTVRASALAVAQFLGGRLCGYLAFAILAWLVHEMLRHGTSGRLEAVAGGGVDLGLAGLLTWYGLAAPRAPCAVHWFAAGPEKGTVPICAKHPQGRSGKWGLSPFPGPVVVPAAMGFLTGLNLCPPFLAAFTGAVRTESLPQSLAFFAFFFLGTSVFFLPLPFLGALRRFSALRTIGRLTALVMAAYYGYAGIKFLALGTLA
jgi:hypothetical protein